MWHLDHRFLASLAFYVASGNTMNLAARCHLQWINPTAATSASAARCHPRWWWETQHGALARWGGSMWHVEVEVTSLAPLLFMPLYLVWSAFFCFFFLVAYPHAVYFWSSITPLYHLTGFFFIHLILSVASKESSYLVCIGYSIIYLYIIHCSTFL